MPRPFFNHSTEQLRAEFEKVVAGNDNIKLKVLEAELENRNAFKARQLLREVQSALNGHQVVRQLSLPITESGPRNTGVSGVRQRHQKLPTARTNSLTYKPTPEQAEGIEAFLSGGSLKINAYAGTGKTSTLELLAQATDSRGQYLAFNRNIVSDAKQKFPETVNCSTTHSLALKGIPRDYRTTRDKCFGKVNANQLAEILKIKKSWRIDKDHVLQPRSQGFLILETVKRFTQSADKEPLTSHVPRHGSLIGASPEVLTAVEAYALDGAKHVWERMCSPRDDLPLGHDGYLKLWALSDPVIAAEFILLDEAQDTNPVVLDVLKKQPAQMIYVGDKYQQIYEWRGAVNAMQEIATDHETRLTQSFRFGSEIAEAASRVLELLGEKIPLIGNPKVKSRIGATEPDTILSRTNASTITALIEALDSNLSPHLVGDSSDIVKMLRGVKELKAGQPCEVPEFFGFNTWAEVVEFANSSEGEHLQTFVKLVESRGENTLLWALNRSVEEKDADIVISTAHKSKGRQWSKVRLTDDFLKSRPRDRAPPATNGTQNGASNGMDPAELRLFYVAMTRAKEEMEIPSNVMEMLGLMGTLPHLEPKPWVQRKSSPEAMPRPPSPKHVWVPPVNWEPSQTQRTATMPPSTPRPERPIEKQKKKGLFSWLFRN